MYKCDFGEVTQGTRISVLDVRNLPDCLEDLYKIYHISCERRERIRNFRFMRDKKLCCGVEILLNEICEELGIIKEEQKIIHGENGKPYFEGNPIFFNMSHSGDYVACAFGRYEVGIDIEHCSNTKLSIQQIKNIFSESECRDILSVEESLRCIRVCEIWTQKEAVVKCSGKGLIVPFNSFSVLEEKYSFWQCRFDGYALCMCVKG